MKVRHLTVLVLIACSAIFGAQAVLAAKPHHHSRHHHRYGFAVLDNAPAKISEARQQFLSIPSDAVLAGSANGNSIYVFQRVQNLEAQTCVSREEGSGMAGGGACGSTEAAEREGLSLIYPNPNGTQRLIVLVPNGVKTVSATLSGNGNATATVANNIAVIEGNLTGYHFVSPAGSSVLVPLEGM